MFLQARTQPLVNPVPPRKAQSGLPPQQRTSVDQTVVEDMALLPPLRTSIALLLAAVSALPLASAWTLAPPPPTHDAPATWSAWTTDLAPQALPSDPAGALVGAVGCALGDVSGDGVSDLVVLVQDPVSGVRHLKALAGPGFTQVVWEKAAGATQVLQCAPDL